MLRYFIAIVAVFLAACTPTPPTPAEKQAAQEQVKKKSKDENIHINHTGW